jgi:hypothetical protein
MSNLEEVWIEDCRSLGDEGFVGTEDDEPVFLMLASKIGYNLQSAVLLITIVSVSTWKVDTDIM